MIIQSAEATLKSRKSNDFLAAKHSETKVSGAQKFRRISWFRRKFVMKGAFT